MVEALSRPLADAEPSVAYAVDPCLRAALDVAGTRSATKRIGDFQTLDNFDAPPETSHPL